MSRSRRTITGRGKTVGWSLAVPLLLAACTAGAVPLATPVSPVPLLSPAPTPAASALTPPQSTEPQASSTASGTQPCPPLAGEPVAGRVVAKIPVARPGTIDAPWALGIGAGSVWVANRGGGLGSVMRIDPGTNTVVATIQLDGKHRGGPGFAQGAVWVGTKTALVRIDAETNEATEIAPLGVESLYAGDEGLWLPQPEVVSRVDPDDGTRLDSIRLPGAVFPAEAAFAAGSLWIVDPDQEEVWRVDTERGEVVTRVPVGNLPHTIEFTEGAAWVAGPGHELDPTAAGCSVVSRIDTQTNAIVATIPVGSQGSAVIETFDGHLWSRPEPGVLARVNPSTNAVDQVLTGLPDGEVTSDIVAGFGSLWVANWTDGTLWRIAP